MKRVTTTFFPPIPIDTNAKIPIYRQLYDWVRDAIVSGQLRPGQRVPSTRALALELKVSRLPVLSAFEQLHAEGYLQTITGSGTMVSQSVPDDAIRPAKADRKVPVQPRPSRKISRLGSSALHAPPPLWLNRLVPFRASVPALDQFPVAIWSKLVTRHARRPTREIMSYGSAMGHLPFREAIAEYLGAARAVRCDASQIMVLTGSQQALQLCAKVLFNPEDPVWMEEPGYPGAHQAFASAGIRLVPVPVDHEGFNVKEGLRLNRRAKGVYLTPSHQYPLGAMMTASRRVEILQWAARAGSWIIEDDYDSEFRFESRPIGALQGLDTTSSVIYVGTFSKVMFPALRLGYIVVPPSLIPAFCGVREATDIFSSTLYQAVMTDFIREGHFARHLRRMRVIYMERRTVLMEELSRQLKGILEVVGDAAGMHLVAKLPAAFDDREVARKAARNGIAAIPLSAYYLKPSSNQGLILGYGCATPKELREGVKKLKAILTEPKTLID